MIRLLVVILVAWLVYRGIESVLGQLRGATGGGAFRPDPPPPPRVTVIVHREPHETTEELVACAHCGDRVPKSRTVAGEGGAVCAACGAG